MKTYLLIGGAMVGLLGLGVYAGASTWGTGPNDNGRWSRACKFPDGGWTAIDCSAAAADAELTANTRWVVQCVGNSHIAWGDATGEDADANDGYLPGGSWLQFLTDATDVFLSCDSAVGEGGGGKCYYIECQ